MKKFAVALILAGMTTITPGFSSTAWASKNCPDGSHPGKGPDPKKVYCYDNNDPSQIVKIIS
ncbi:MAG: hypothetical protein AB1679_01530 [Actinomycetota bacterium]